MKKIKCILKFISKLVSIIPIILKGINHLWNDFLVEWNEIKKLLDDER